MGVVTDTDAELSLLLVAKSSRCRFCAIMLMSTTSTYFKFLAETTIRSGVTCIVLVHQWWSLSLLMCNEVLDDAFDLLRDSAITGCKTRTEDWKMQDRPNSTAGGKETSY